jgi:hypothetical protein
MEGTGELINKGNVAHLQRLDPWWLFRPFNASVFNASQVVANVSSATTIAFSD